MAVGGTMKRLHLRSCVVGAVTVAMVSLGAAIPLAGASSGGAKLTTIKYGTGGSPELPVNPAKPKSGNGGATAQGVTATSINIGDVMSISGPTPGVFNDVTESAQAYVDYVNSLGGVYGRKLSLSVGDDAYDVTKDQAVCAKLIPQSFALVASYGFADAGCYPQVKSSGIPWISQIVFDPQLYGLPNVIAPNPVAYSNLEQEVEIAAHKGTPIKKVWLCEIQAPGIAAQAAPETAVWESLGVQVLNLAPLPADATNYTAEVVQAKEDGADAVDCFSTPSQIDATVALEMAQQNWNPPIKRGYAIYSPTFVKLAGEAGKGWTTSVGVPYLNQKEFTSTPGGKLYSKWFKKVTGQQAPFEDAGSSGWTEMDLFVQALVRTGPDLTWSKLLKTIKTTKAFNNFSADGVTPPYKVWPTSNGSCLAVVEDNGTALVQEAPKAGYLDCGGKLLSG